MAEKIRPVLFINKVDRFIYEHEADSESMYLQFSNTIDRVNVVTSCYELGDQGLGLEVHPSIGNVAFGSGKDCWGFTLK